MPNQVSPEERLEVAMRRFDNINPANVPAAASMPASTNTNDDNENNEDEGGSEPPTVYRRIMSPENRQAANRRVVMTRRHLPKKLCTGEGRDAFVNLMKTLQAVGFESFDKKKGKWFEENIDSLFDENQRGIFSK